MDVSSALRPSLLYNDQMTDNTLQIEKLTSAAVVPTYAHEDDAGMDLRASEEATIPARSRALVGTGIAIALPEGHVGLVHPRSGLAAKHGVTVLNAPGTIDAGYRGEVKVILLNTSDEAFNVAIGDRIAQLVVQKVEHPAVEVVALLDGNTARGAGGFGSTGVS